MILERLKLYHFRNLADQSVEFSRGVNVIAGRNGQGKTNLIEAINVLAVTKSFRTSTTREVVGWGNNDASVFGAVRGAHGVSEIGVSFEGKTKSVYLNGEKARSLGEYLGRLIAVSFSPSDLSLVKGAPAGRRRFLDKHLVDLSPALLAHLSAYQRALEHKNNILREGATPRALEPWNGVLAQEAAPILAARRQFVAELSSIASETMRRFAPEQEVLTLQLETNVEGGESEQLAARAIEQQLNAAALREIAQRTAVVGPHRDDMAIALSGQDARAYASQGQTRSIVLALTLGVLSLIESRKGESPLVLLDDVNSELDQQRAERFFELVIADGRQIFITGTDSSVGYFERTEGVRLYQMEGGKLTGSRG